MYYLVLLSHEMTRSIQGLPSTMPHDMVEMPHGTDFLSLPSHIM